jgi:aspartate/methionine/tyrosine aminotransferase
VCSPANPQGAVMQPEAMRQAVALARRHDFALAFDECYCEIYPDTPPTGVLQALAESGDHSLDNILVFHSLSKRSNAAGLRCGVVAGEPALIDALDAAMRLGGAGVPLPVAAAGARLWRDEEHVEANRARYRENFEVAARVLGNRFDARPPDGGFFLWLEVGDGEKAALALWRAAGIRSLPGAYMAHEGPQGDNPGRSYLRLALVYDRPVIEAALMRIAEVL